MTWLMRLVRPRQARLKAIATELDAALALRKKERLAGLVRVSGYVRGRG